MKLIDPKKYSKSKTDEAGIILRDNLSSKKDKNIALEILNNWRASHNYPMQVFMNRLKRVSGKVDKKALLAQRLKRVPSIIKKLNRVYISDKATMRLTQMQDIAGCRVILSNVKLVRQLYHEYYQKGNTKHKKFNEIDYISKPKDDGYRSIHLIYKYNSDKENRKIYNGLLVEVQIRSKLQHIWATAVETVGFFSHQAIKSNEGQDDWKLFFKLMSNAFAMMESCSILSDIPNKEEELYHFIKKMELELNAITKMENWLNSLKIIENFNKKKKIHFFLLELDTIQEKLLLTGYSKRQEEKAMLDYANAERRIYGKKEYDVVLVSVDLTADLKKAYPNYFLDTTEFIGYLKKILQKY